MFKRSFLVKKIILSFGLILTSSLAFAGQRIDLSSGSSAVLNVGQSTLVTCAGASSTEQTMKCKIVKRDEYSGTYYDVSSGGNALTTVRSLDEAIKQAKNLSEAGLCQ